MKQYTQTFLIWIVIAFTIVGLVYLFELQSHNAGASTPGNLPTTVATSSTRVVGKQDDVLLFTHNTSCASRIISTGGQAIKLSLEAATTTGGGPGHFGVASTTISAIEGFVQAASTTVVYPADEYGCSAINAFSFEASTTITIAETR